MFNINELESKMPNQWTLIETNQEKNTIVVSERCLGMNIRMNVEICHHTDLGLYFGDENSICE